jgi:hypothetical protein
MLDRHLQGRLLVQTCGRVRSPTVRAKQIFQGEIESKASTKTAILADQFGVGSIQMGRHRRAVDDRLSRRGLTTSEESQEKTAQQNAQYFSGRAVVSVDNNARVVSGGWQGSHDLLT